MAKLECKHSTEDNTAVLWEAFGQLVWRPWSALVLSLEMTTKEITPRLLIDSMLSRAVHTLSRPLAAHSQADKDEPVE